MNVRQNTNSLSVTSTDAKSAQNYIVHSPATGMDGCQIDQNHVKMNAEFDKTTK